MIPLNVNTSANDSSGDETISVNAFWKGVVTDS